MKLIFLMIVCLAFAGVVCGQANSTMPIKVYFHPDKVDPEWEDCQKVAPVKRTIPKTASVATAALYELFKGPTAAEAKEYSGFTPPETDGILRSVKVKNGGAYVNFTKRVLIQMGNATSSCGGGFFSMIEATLKQFPTIKNVYYAVEGDANEFYGFVQVGDCPHGRHCRKSNF
jgi:spore germination protein GerM